MKAYGYMIFLGATILLTLCAFLTLLPNSHASEANFIGYKSLCSFSPISTVLCVLFAGTMCKIRKKIFITG